MQSQSKHNPTQSMFPILRGGPVGMTNKEKAAIEKEGKDEKLKLTCKLKGDRTAANGPTCPIPCQGSVTSGGRHSRPQVHQSSGVQRTRLHDFVMGSCCGLQPAHPHDRTHTRPPLMPRPAMPSLPRAVPEYRRGHASTGL